MDKILRIKMGASDGPKSSVESAGTYAGLGGRALTTAVICNEVDPGSDPLGKENKLVIAPGLLSGTSAAMSSRLSIGFKSPLTGGIKESNAGGEAAKILGRLGFAAVIIEGKPDRGKLYSIRISSKGVEISDASKLRQLPNYELMAEIKKDLVGNKMAACLSIGTAGERGMLASTIAATDPELRPTRHAARGGGGAVMGSKGVKVLILDGSGTKPRAPFSPYFFKAANKQFVEGLRRNPITGHGLPSYGTNIMTNIINESGAYPTKNFASGYYDKAENISGEKLAELQKKRGGQISHGCHGGCVIKCSGTFNDADGNFVTKQPEYETVWAHGGNCLIDDLDIIARLDYLDDNFGLDTIEMGSAVGIAMEAGVIEFGDGEGAIRLIKEAGAGTGLGAVIGNGAAATADELGVSRAPVVKRQAMPAYDPRGIMGIGVTYATSTMGADHTAGYTMTANVLRVGGFVEPLSPDNQAFLSQAMQVACAAIDSIGMCLQVAFALLDQPETYQAMLDMINAATGLVWAAEDLNEVGRSILIKEKEFNKAAGFTKADDRLPEFFYKESIGPHNKVFEVSDDDLDQVLNI